MLLDRSRSQLVIVDVQTKLVPAMSEFLPVERNCQKLLTAARRLGVPVTITEQYPAGLGRTIDSLQSGAAPEEILEKMTFSSAADAGISQRLRVLDRKQVILAGIEAHVCVLQTALGLILQGFAAFVVMDAVTSRSRASVEFAADRLRSGGVELVSTEMVMFEWLERAGTAEFKSMRDLIV